VKLREALASGYILGDGANGTGLFQRGFHHTPYDLANLDAPELVVEVHRAYLDAGADFIETNTFQANRYRLPDETDVARVNLAGARLARQAAGPKLVLGAIGPTGKRIEPIGTLPLSDAKEAFADQARALAEGGVDGFILETFIDLEELRAAVQGVKSVSDLPIIASKAFIEDGELLASGYPTRCAAEIEAMGVDAVGANCIVGPQRMLDLVRMLAEGTNLPILAFPTPGMPQLVKGIVSYDTSPDYYAKASLRLLEEGAQIIGGCCGTGPSHIQALRQAMCDTPPKPKARSTASTRKSEERPIVSADPSDLSRKLGSQFVTAIEMDVPRGLNIGKLLAGAQLLKDFGVDVINISDGARARLRMNPTAVANLIQSQIGIEATMHFSCRDRNLLAIQSDLLGAHALGIRNILAVTGDPANIGDYPSATSVFDIDAIGLVRILARFNEGIDLAGYSVGQKCAFTIAAAFNPLPLDKSLEWDRLRRKADAGASVIYTQPVFSDEGVELAVSACRDLGLPVLVGVLPLRTQRHCEFMHNEVPGISVPDWLRKKMADAPDDATAGQIGIEEAQRLSGIIKSKAQGLYLMPPFGNPGVALSVLGALA
jgi:homocysteine S-methyltransferase